MCGICGIYRKNRKITETELLSMRDSMIHRGPDESGIYLNNSVGIAHRRLSIIDLESGRQPISNEDQSIWCVYNGEIYNYLEIINELKQKGHRLKSSCDTEILVHLYEDYGIKFLEKLQGMFAFAIWDTKKNLLFCARDRLGIKPFYYHYKDEQFAFASEIKALLTLESIPRKINKELINEYLTFRFVSGENTLIKGIKTLQPGHLLVMANDELKIEKYWDHADTKKSLHNFHQTVKELDNLLESSVKKRLISDVPLGTLNSGGIDSSLVSAYAADLKSEPINTYSVGFSEKKFDESKYAKIVSEQLNSEHHTLLADRTTFAQHLPEAIWYNDEPVNHANSVLLMLICRLAKNKVTVLLTGEGADEAFGGYPRYWIMRLIGKIPLKKRKIIASIMRYFPGHYFNKLSEFYSMNRKDALNFNAAFVHPDKIDGLLSGEYGKGSKYRDNLVNKYLKTMSMENSVFHLDLKTYLVSILNRMDKMSMAASVEARVPFLDHVLLEYAMGIKSQFKLKLSRLQTKYALKKLAEKRLPKEVIYRKKYGFGIPIDAWLRADDGLKPYVYLLLEKDSFSREICNEENLEKLITEHMSSKSDHGDILWGLINLEMWYRIFIDKNMNIDDVKIITAKWLHQM